MNGKLKYVCDIDDSNQLKSAYEDLRAFQKRDKEQREFIAKMIRDLERENLKHWEALFDAARVPGNVDPKTRFEDVNLHIVDSGRQLLMSESDYPFGNLLDGFLKTF